MKALKTITYRFKHMNKAAISLLRICLHLTLTSVCITLVYIDSASHSALFWLWCERSYIISSILWSLILSFGGAFLLDYAAAADKKDQI